MFSEEPNILDENFHASQNERFERSADEKQPHRRSRRNSPIPKRVTDPVITKSKPLCDHNDLIIRWTDTNLVSQTSVIVALCRDAKPSTATRNNASVFVSNDHGLSWRNLTDDFAKLLGKRPTIDMYYTDPDTPSFILFADKVNKKIFITKDGAKTMNMSTARFAPEDISFNRGNPKIILASYADKYHGKATTRLAVSKDHGASFNTLAFVDVNAFYWGSIEDKDRATDLFVEAKESGGNVQGCKLDCSSTSRASTCGIADRLTTGTPLNDNITDFLVKGPYMFVTKHSQDKPGLELFVKYKRTGTFKKANIMTSRPLKEVFVYDVSGDHVMLVVNLRKNETNLYNSLDKTGLNYSLSLPRVLYHNPHTEVSSHWLRKAARYRFVDIWRARGLTSVYFATQLTVGPVGGRYLISKMTFDKGGVWKKIQGPERNKYGRLCRYPACSLHINLLYGSIYRYSQTTPLLSRKSAPGLIMVTGVLGTNLKITPSTFLSRDGGNTFKMVLHGKRRYNFGDQGGFVLASDFHSSTYIQYSVDYENFYPVKLPNTSSVVDIKMILTEPGEKGVTFLVVGVVKGFYHVFQVNATKTLDRPCTEKDFYKVNVTDVGVGGCAVQQVQIRNESAVCITGKDYTRVEKIFYSSCMCRRRHYICDVMFTPDKRGSCVQIPGTQLIPNPCPEGTTFRKSRGYFKMPEYSACKEDNETWDTLSPVETPCPVEMLQLAHVLTTPPMTNRLVHLELGQSLRIEVQLSNGFLPHIDFVYALGSTKVSGRGHNYTSATFSMTKLGQSVIHIKVSNTKSNLYYSVHVNVLRKLETKMSFVVYPPEPSIGEKVAVVLQMNSENDLRDYGSVLNYQWVMETVNPSRQIILNETTLVPTLFTKFNVSGIKTVRLRVSNAISSSEVSHQIIVTRDLKPKNVMLTFNDPLLTVKWHEVQEPNIERYRVWYRKGQNGPFKEASCRPKRTVTKCDIRNVAYYTMYYVKVDTVLDNEFGAESDLASILIPSGKPGVPQKVKLANVGAVKLEASWSPPLLPNGKLAGYRYKFYKSGETPSSAGKFTKVTSTSFDKLNADAVYIFEVAAVNEKYTGDFSEAKSARTGVDAPTLPPTDIEVRNTTTTTAVLTWTPPRLRNGSKFYFSPQFYNIYMKNGSEMKLIDKALENRYTFTKLTPNTVYEGGIAAVANKAGPTARFSFTTSSGPPSAPVDLKASDISAHGATLSWSLVGRADKIIGYTLYQISPPGIRQQWTVKTTEKQVIDLQPFTKYTFAVSATNVISEGKKSKNFTFTTKQDKPEKPEIVHTDVLWPESSSVNVSWDAPRVPNGEITKYAVTWFPKGNEAEKEVTIVKGKRWLQVNHLKQITMYIFAVQAYTKIGGGGANYRLLKTPRYPFGSRPIIVPFEESSHVNSLAKKKNYKKIFVEKVASIADIRSIRIADVRLSIEENAVVFELISKEELLESSSQVIQDEIDHIIAKLQPSFSVLDFKTKANAIKSGKVHSGKPAASSKGTGGSTNMALVVGLVCAVVVLVLLIVIAMMFFRYRRKSQYNKFDNNFQYNHDDDAVHFQGSTEVEMSTPSNKHRHKDIETVPLADADELT